MDLYYNQLKIIFLFILLFFGCESIIENNINETTSELEVISFYVNYDDQENEISVYLEVSESNEISSVLAEISNPDNDEIITEFDLVNLGDLNPNVFIYEGSLPLSDNVYIYSLNLIINSNNENYLLTEDFSTTPIEPEIIEFIMTDTHQLDQEEWTVVPIDIQISDLNGLDNIEFVMYEVQRAFNGCNGDCNLNPECNESITDDDYINDDSWIFSYVESNNDDTDHSYQYHVDIPMRPVNGAALYDEDENIIFEEADCGRTGIVFFKFLVIDKDGLSDYIIDIPLEITE